jgi:hypothetical protein
MGTLHESILYPVTRVRSQKAGGSGVLVYSGPDSENEGNFINVVLTCQHVIDDSIAIKEEWDSVVKRNVKKDVKQEVQVEVFDYDGSELVSANNTRAEIIAYDKNHDLAALKLHSSREMEHVARIIPEDAIKDLYIGAPMWVCGCSLLHDPFPGQGILTYMDEIIDQKSYTMYNAPSVFGNSGGGYFLDDGKYLLGLCSRISATQIGFGVDIMTWMGFGTHPKRLYEFFRHQELQFLYDPSDDFYAGQKRLEKKRKDSLRNLLMDGKEADKESEEDLV